MPSASYVAMSFSGTSNGSHPVKSNAMTAIIRNCFLISILMSLLFIFNSGTSVCAANLTNTGHCIFPSIVLDTNISQPSGTGIVSGILSLRNMPYMAEPEPDIEAYAAPWL